MIWKNTLKIKAMRPIEHTVINPDKLMEAVDSLKEHYPGLVIVDVVDLEGNSVLPQKEFKIAGTGKTEELSGFLKKKIG